jgi:hypothetical protein
VIHRFSHLFKKKFSIEKLLVLKSQFVFLSNNYTITVKQVSISLTFYKQLCCMKVLQLFSTYSLALSKEYRRKS